MVGEDAPAEVVAGASVVEEVDIHEAAEGEVGVCVVAEEVGHMPQMAAVTQTAWSEDRQAA